MTQPSKTRLEDRLLAGVERIWGRDSLTVLAYHRIRNPEEFPYFEPVISATPDGFRQQMDIIADRFNPISLHDLHSWLDGAISLPPRAALITFDDGYRDNLEFAMPILEQRGLPAVVFLPTDYIGRDRPFFWDSAAFIFGRTAMRNAELPLLGSRSWTTSSSICADWVEAVKRIPEDQKEETVQQLGEVLGVEMPDDAYSGELLTWDEIRNMLNHGFSFGSHTLSHPILTQLSPQDLFRELAESKKRIQDELGMEVRSLAYPNGMPTDFNSQVEEAANNVGYSAAFTLVPGPARHREAAADPLAIRRISLYLDDGSRRFRAKLAGGGRIKSSLS